MPKRLQLTRLEGRVIVPSGAARVDRATIFGNPCKAPDPRVAVEAMRQWLDGEPIMPAEGLEMAFIPAPDRRATLLRRLPELRGRDCACWCAPDALACHAELLIERANRTAPPGNELEAAAVAALAAARQAPDAVSGLVDGLRAAWRVEREAEATRPHTAGRNRAAFGGLGAAVRRRRDTETP